MEEALDLSSDRLLNYNNLPETSLTVRLIARDIIINVHVKYPLLLSDVIKFELSRQIFEKYADIKLHENPFSGSRVVLCGRKD